MKKDKAEILDKIGIELLPGISGATEERIHHMETHLGYEILPENMNGSSIFTEQFVSTFSGRVHNYTCGHCGVRVAGIVVASCPNRSIEWLGCPACHNGSVANSDGVVYPMPLPGDEPQGLEDPIKGAYLEARKSLSSQNNTACVLMCRKILMHVAVDKGATKGKQFVDYVDYLVEQGHITPAMRDWVDQIRKLGNNATHEIPSPDYETANLALTFTTLLLKNMYEIAHLLNRKSDNE